MKAHILIVEDEAVLYDRLSQLLLKNNYTVSDYCPSVADAVKEITLQKPDIALLDINLQGELTGIDLGKKLHTEYNIPFVYVTQYDDNETFFKSLHTNHEQFVVKTKPKLNTEEVLRAIQTALHKKEEKAVVKKGVMGLITYLEDSKESGASEITKIPINYTDIAYFSTKPFINQNEEEEIVRVNYVCFFTKTDYYFLKTSLKELQPQLPQNFIRINEGTIVNLHTSFFNGRINGSRLSVCNKQFAISNTYKKEVVKRIEQLYV